MTHPIPDAALDDRLGFIGTSGSGKTYNAGSAVERLLERRARVVIIDPLGVWWGLRLTRDGKQPSPFNVAIFGGPRGDLPLNEHAGALIGETAATMAESCIVDLRELGSKSAERRFMVAFLETIYRKADGVPFHLIVDEADLFAPQKPQRGDEVLLGHMENIVRRGRVKGFIPWLISQRPAVLNKNVLSQVDGLIAFKLTATQDRDALDAWIEGQADKAKGKEIKDALPTMQVGTGVVWLPSRGMLKTAQFPLKITFDSSRAPKRGEKQTRVATLKPIDIGALKERLAIVAKEKDANDPVKLRQRIIMLERTVGMAAGAGPQAIADARAEGYDRGLNDGSHIGYHDGFAAAAAAAVKQTMDFAGHLQDDLKGKMPKSVSAPTTVPSSTAGTPKRAPVAAVAARPPSPASGGDGTITGPQRQMLQSLAWWAAMGHDQPSRVQIAAICGWRVTSGHIKNIAGSLRTLGLIEYPTGGTITLTAAGRSAAPAPNTSTTLEDSVRGILNGPQLQVFEVLPPNGVAMSREHIAAACGWEPTSGHIKNILGSMRSLEVICYPTQGQVARERWLVP